MRVLVTRSGQGGLRLAAALRGRGADVIHYAPVIPGPVDDPRRLQQHLRDSLPCELLVAPSAEALRQLVALLGAEALQHAELIVPGPGTAAAARSLGLGPCHYPLHQGTSEEILKLPVLAQVAGKRVLIAAAAEGRGLIADALARRGALVQCLAVYQRRLFAPSPAVLQALCQPEPLISLLASGGALEALRTQLPEACWERVSQAPMIAPSERVARLAQVAGCVDVHAAAGADDQAMLGSLLALCPELS
ncbi:MAG: uroporphyrinogen-III synthase [Wenzhouxiangella sp.]